MTVSRWKSALFAIVASLLLLAACGDDDDASTTTTTEPDPTAEVGEPSAEDPAALDENAGRDDPELLSLQAFLAAWVDGDRDAAAAVADEFVLQYLDTEGNGWSGDATATLRYDNETTFDVGDYYTCMESAECLIFLQTATGEYLLTLEGDFITSIEFPDF